MSVKTSKIVSTIGIISALSIIGIPIAFVCMGVLVLDDIWDF